MLAVRFGLVFCVFGLSGVAGAQQSEPPEEEAATPAYFFELDQALGKAEVVSASRQAEPLRETPVPVTLITREMIRAIGARTLQDVLLAYVPGMTPIEDHNEMNVAMRGVYASSQQKILILLDGHRLNSRAYSSANPDYSLDLEKVKQIEVLRGPGSSIYGNVALTAVINVVTRSPEEVDGVEARVGVGNFGQRRAQLTMGKDFGDNQSFLVWGSYFESKGEPRAVSAADDIASVPRDGVALLNAIRGPPSYDFGVKVQLHDFSALFSTRMGSYVEPFTGGGVTGEVYPYNAFRTLDGMGPGLASRSDHLELGYTRALSDKWEIDARLYTDRNDLKAIVVANPSAVSANALGWNEVDFGGTVQARYAYEAGKVGTGNVLFGAQVDQVRLLDSYLGLQSGGEWTGFGDKRARQVLEPGVETIYSGFAQVKQRIGSALILNAGVRYDEKDRHKGDSIDDVSPRLAVIYAPAEWVDMKLSYAQAFVDAPYWYRYNSLASYRGAETLTPEHLRSIQFTPTVRFLDGKVVNTLNVFYNDLYDFVYRNNQAAANEPIYQNAGLLRTIGVEDEFSYLQDWYRIRANLTWQRVLEGKSYGTRDGLIYNVPPIMGNVIADVQPLRKLFEHLWLNASVRVVSQQLSPIDVRFANGVTYNEPDRTVAAYALVSAGVRISKVYTEGLSLDAQVYNLLDARYEQGGSTNHAYPQPGRWFLVNLGYAFQ